MTFAKEQDWAQALKCSQNHTRGRHQTVPLATQKQHVREELIYFKHIVREALKERKQTELDRATQKLVGLRAKQVAIDIQEERQRGFTINSFILERAFRRYYHDCYRLLHAIDALRM